MVEIGAPAGALEDFVDSGWVRAHGERWRARARSPVTRGQPLTIVGREDLVLDVEPDNLGGKG